MNHSRQGQAGAALAEKSLLKRQQDARDEIAHLLQNANDGLTFKALNLAERYVEGRLELYLELRSRCCGEKFHVIVRAGKFQVMPAIGGLAEYRAAGIIWGNHVPSARPCVGRGDHVGSSTRAENKGKSDCALDRADLFFGGSEIDRRQKRMVLSVNVHVVEEEQERSGPARMSFGVSKALNDVGGKMFFLPFKGTFKTLGVSPYRELDSAVPLAFLGCQCEMVGQRGQHLVQRGAEIVEGVGSSALDVVGDAVGLKTPDFLCSIWVDLGYDAIRARFEEGADCGIEILDVGFGPFNLGVGRSQRFKIHDWPGR